MNLDTIKEDINHRILFKVRLRILARLLSPIMWKNDKPNERERIEESVTL